MSWLLVVDVAAMCPGGYISHPGDYVRLRRARLGADGALVVHPGVITVPVVDGVASVPVSAGVVVVAPRLSFYRPVEPFAVEVGELGGGSVKLSELSGVVFVRNGKRALSAG